MWRFWNVAYSARIVCIQCFLASTWRSFSSLFEILCNCGTRSLRITLNADNFTHFWYRSIFNYFIDNTCILSLFPEPKRVSTTTRYYRVPKSSCSTLHTWWPKNTAKCENLRDLQDIFMPFPPRHQVLRKMKMFSFQSCQKCSHFSIVEKMVFWSQMSTSWKP